MRSSRWRRPRSTRMVAPGGAAPMNVLANSELQNKSGANPSDRSTRHIEVELPAERDLPRRRSPERGAAQRSRAGRFRRAALRLPAGGPDPAAGAREGRRAQLPVGEVVSVGRLLTEFVELQQVATRKQIQIMSEHTRCPMTKPKLLALVGDDDARPSATAPRCWRSANRCSTCWRSIRPANCRSPPISKCCRCWRRATTRSRRRPRAMPATLQRHRRRGARRRRVRAAASIKGVCSNYLVGPPRRRHHPRHRARDQGGLPPAGRPGEADHHGRPRHGARAVPRLPAGARGAQGQGRHARPRDAVLRLPPSRAGFPLCRRTEGLCAPRASSICTSRSRAPTDRRPMCRT